MRTLFGFGGGHSLLHFLFKDFGEKLSTVNEEKIVHLVEDVSVSVGSGIADGIEVGEKGLKAFMELPCR
jgi:hypothetical protein